MLQSINPNRLLSRDGAIQYKGEAAMQSLLFCKIHYVVKSVVLLTYWLSFVAFAYANS